MSEPVAPAVEDTPGEVRGRVIERPDGFYWQDSSNGEIYGPFPTLLAATQDMEGRDGEDQLEEGESLEEAESEIGITGWIDPDTGMPAEETTPRRTDE